MAISVNDATSGVAANPFSDLRKKMKQTASCRFNAATRLHQRDQTLTQFSAFFSAYLIILNVFPLIFHIDFVYSRLFVFFGIGFSIVILTSSLLQYSQGDSVNSELHHRCALEVMELVRSMDLVEEKLQSEKLSDYMGKYNLILQKFNLNHGSIDFKSLQLERREEYKWLKIEDFVFLWLEVNLPRVARFFLFPMTTILFVGFLVLAYFRSAPN